MLRNNSLGVVSGLTLVALVVAMIGTFDRVSTIVLTSVNVPAYVLAGSPTAAR